MAQIYIYIYMYIYIYIYMCMQGSVHVHIVRTVLSCVLLSVIIIYIFHVYLILQHYSEHLPPL